MSKKNKKIRNHPVPAKEPFSESKEMKDIKAPTQTVAAPFKIEKHWQSTSEPKDRIVRREFESTSGGNLTDTTSHASPRFSHGFFN